jgi:ElaB/YqjD/DUF883 family membrane-anchored ribosome-binding protein
MQTKSARQAFDHAPLELAQEAVAKGRQAAQEAMALGREVTQDFVSRGRDAVQQQLGAATSWASGQAKSQPLRAMAVAAAVGALVALLLTRR